MLSIKTCETLDSTTIFKDIKTTLDNLEKVDEVLKSMESLLAHSNQTDIDHNFPYLLNNTETIDAFLNGIKVIAADADADADASIQDVLRQKQKHLQRTIKLKMTTW